MKPKLPVEPAELALLARYFQGELPDTPIGNAVARWRGKEARASDKWMEYELARDIFEWWQILKDYQELEEHELTLAKARKAKERERNRLAMAEGIKAKEATEQAYRDKRAEKARNATPEDRARAYALWQSARKDYSKPFKKP